MIMMEWEELRKGFNFTEEEEEEIRIEKEIIEAIVNAREKNKLSQRDLSEISGIPKTTIARIETNAVTPQISTLIRYLNAIGYRIKIEPKKITKKSVRQNCVAEDEVKYG